MGSSQLQHYLLMTRVIQQIQSNTIPAHSLNELAEQVGMSEHHFQRIFSSWAGVSPKRFQQFLTKERAKNMLSESNSVLETSLELGLSGSGRLHDLMIRCEAMTPGEIKSKGEGMQICFGSAVTPLGNSLIAWTGRGICYLAFYDETSEVYVKELMAEWPNAEFIRNDHGANECANKIFINPELDQPLYLLLKGTNFQIKVWEALLRVSCGQLVSYSQLARIAGSPKASRAVGSAMAANKIGFLIPCHRVIRESGELGHYRWGVERKSALQAWEACKAEEYSD
ncbi:MAG: bifunctional helix-turn-helix domain-containing protein/methylated-DNA--[protein]-cysteine S-methyltransferase [Neptuniibacter sp.]